jgi:Domain of unknown function (DUF1707)
MSSNPFDTAWTRPRNPARDMNMRIGDAERQQVADALSTHYAEGRLDVNEFNERMSQAMAAKTRADLAGLLTDLPSSAPGALPAPKPVRHRSRLLAMVLLAIVIAGAASALGRPSIWWWHIPWLLIAVVVFLVLRATRLHHHRFHHHADSARLDEGHYRHGHRHW